MASIVRLIVGTLVVLEGEVASILAKYPHVLPAKLLEPSLGNCQQRRRQVYQIDCAELIRDEEIIAYALDVPAGAAANLRRL